MREREGCFKRDGVREREKVVLRERERERVREIEKEGYFNPLVTSAISFVRIG